MSEKKFTIAALKLNKFHAIAIVLVIILGVASVIGFGGFFATQSPGGEDLGQDQDVFLQDPEDDDNWKLERSEEFFVEYRLERERVRSKELDLLQQMVNNPNTTDDSKREAEQKIMQLKELMELELNVESSLMGLGYKHAILFFQNGNANVVVNAEALTREEKAHIAEIVSRAAGVERYQVTITEKGN